jgi:predicted PhzF superfamily epimerase YddE/YHI9
MQQIAREFNFSESTFVLPPETGKTRRVRVFTPVTELPFAGHPNIGTAFALASTGELGAVEESLSIVFEEGAGLVPIDIGVANGVPTRCELSAPEALTLTDDADLQAVADVLSLTPDDIVTDHHAPCGASVGLTFVFAELSGLDALARAPAAGPAAQGSKRAGAASPQKKTPRRSLWGSPGREFRSAKDPASHRSGARGPRIGFSFGYRLLAGEGDLLVGLQVSSTTLGGAAVP